MNQPKTHARGLSIAPGLTFRAARECGALLVSTEQQPSNRVATPRGRSWWTVGDRDTWDDEASKAADRMAAEDTKKVGRGMTIGWAVSGRKP